MNLWRQKNIDKYLYELIDDYKTTDSKEEKDDLFKSFCSSIWSSENKRRVYNKTISYNVKKSLLDTEIGKIFDAWSIVEYKGYKAMTKHTDWISLIRQKVNNLYTRYFDKDVILKKDYMVALGTPKKLYYEWIDGTEMNLDEITVAIDNAIDNALKLKNIYQKQKMDLSWNDYKKVINGFFEKIFKNCKLIENYEADTGYNNLYDFINEDNFYISYFCKSLEGELLKWQKKYYGVRDHQPLKRCQLCGKLIEKTGNKKMYCNECAKTKEKLRKRKIAYKYRVAK